MQRFRVVYRGISHEKGLHNYFYHAIEYTVAR